MCVRMFGEARSIFIERWHCSKQLSALEFHCRRTVCACLFAGYVRFNIAKSSHGRWLPKFLIKIFSIHNYLEITITNVNRVHKIKTQISYYFLVNKF